MNKSLLIRQVIIEKIPVTKEQVFLDMMVGLEIKEDKEKYPNSIFLFKDDLCYFEIYQDQKNKSLYCNYDKVWSFFEIKFGLNYTEIKYFIKHIVETHFKMKGLTPPGIIYDSFLWWKHISK